MSKKIKKMVLAVCICAMMVSGSAFAANHSFSFRFTDLNNQNTQSYAKSDNSNKWYISLDAAGNNMSASNIFGCRMHRTNNDGVDSYHTFSNYVSSYGITYTAAVAAGDNMYLAAKKDSASTSTAALNISGRFAP